MELSLSDTTSDHILLTEVTWHPSTLDDSLPREEGDNDSPETLPPICVSRRRAEGLPSCDKDSHVTDSFIINEDFNPIGKEVNLLKNGLSKQD
jgi:hypothetical protein